MSDVEQRQKDGSPTTPKERITRTRLGCLTCRMRKVKCDLTPDRCSNCQRINLRCQWDFAQGQRPIEIDYAQLEGTRRTRRRKPVGQSVCNGCKSARSRCSKNRPACDRCVAWKIRCEYDAGSDSHSSSPANTSQDLSTSRLVSDTPNILEEIDWYPLVDTFFTHVYPNNLNAIVTRGEIRRAIEAGGFNQPLIKAVMAVAYRFSADADPRHPDGGTLPAQWARDVHLSALETFGQLSETKVTTLLLLLQHERNCGRHSSCWMLNALAVRMALALRYNVEDISGRTSAFTREKRRRLMWAAVGADGVANAGIKEFTLIPRGTISCRHPCGNALFDIGDPDVTGGNDTILDNGDRENNILSRLLVLMSIRSDVLRYVKNLTRSPQPAWDTASEFHNQLRKLEAWKVSLQPALRLDPVNLYLYKSTAELDQLLSIHLWYEQISSDLYRIALPGFLESAPATYLQAAPVSWILDAQKECYKHSVQATSIFRMLETHVSGHTISDVHFTVFAYESIRNQIQYIHSVSMGIQMPEARKESILGFEAVLSCLKRMTTYFACVFPLVDDLETMMIRHGFRSGTPRACELDVSTVSAAAKEPVISQTHWLRRLWMEQASEQGRRLDGAMMRPNRDQLPRALAVHDDHATSADAPVIGCTSPTASSAIQSLWNQRAMLARTAQVPSLPNTQGCPENDDHDFWSDLSRLFDANNASDELSPFFGFSDAWTANTLEDPDRW